MKFLRSFSGNTLRDHKTKKKSEKNQIYTPLSAYKKKQVATQFVKNKYYTHFQVSFQHISTEERNVSRPTELGYVSSHNKVTTVEWFIRCCL